MISLENIHSFTQFQRQAKTFADQVRDTKQPIILTVNGEAALVVHDASAFQSLLDRMNELEEELKTLRVQSLREDLQVGLDQANQGEFSEQTLSDIKLEGRRILAERQG